MSADDDRQARWQRFLEHLRTAPGALPADERRAVFAHDRVPAPLEELVDTEVRHAYRVTDEHVAAAAAAGYSEDAIYEAIVLAAAGEADRRRERVRALIAEAGDDAAP